MIAISLLAGVALLTLAANQHAAEALAPPAAADAPPLPPPAAISAEAITIPVDCAGAAAHGGSAADAINDALGQARAARARSPGQTIVVRFAPGICRLGQPITLTAADAGAPGAPLVLQGAAGGGTVLSGAVPLAPAGPGPHDDILPAAARPAVHHFALPPGDVARLAADAPRGSNGPPRPAAVILIEGSHWLDVAHWPDAGYAQTAGSSAMKGPNVAPVLTAPSAKTRQWSNEAHLTASGYWAYDWLYEATPVASATPDGRVTLKPLASRYGEGANMYWQILNSASDIDHPGEYAIDPDARLVTVWPLTPSAPVETVEAAKLLVVSGSHDIRLDRLDIRGALDIAVEIDNSSRVVVSNSRIADVGAMAIFVNGGASDIIWRTVVADAAEDGVDLKGGDVGTLARGNHAVIDSVLMRFARLTHGYRPGVRLTGVGLTIQGSLFKDSSSNAVMFAGNDNLILGNEFTHVVSGSIDQGAVYAGRNLLWRGNVIEGNFFHDIRWDLGPGATPPNDLSPRAVYFDDFMSENKILRNVFYDLNDAILVNNGSDVEVSDNLFACLEPGVKPIALWIADSPNAWTRLGFDALAKQGADGQFTKFGAPTSAVALYRSRYRGLAHSFGPDGGAPSNETALGNSIAGLGDYQLLGRTTGNFGAVTRLPPVSCQVAGAARTALLRRLIAGSGLSLADRDAALVDLPYYSSDLRADQ